MSKSIHQSIASFDTKDFGIIEVARRSQGDVASETAYFAKDDYETGVGSDGAFSNQWGTRFKILWPLRGMRSKDAILEVTKTITLGWSKVKENII